MICIRVHSFKTKSWFPKGSVGRHSLPVGPLSRWYRRALESFNSPTLGSHVFVRRGISSFVHGWRRTRDRVSKDEIDGIIEEIPQTALGILKKTSLIMEDNEEDLEGKGKEEENISSEHLLKSFEYIWDSLQSQTEVPELRQDTLYLFTEFLKKWKILFFLHYDLISIPPTMSLNRILLYPKKYSNVIFTTPLSCTRKVVETQKFYSLHPSRFSK